jgi:hypothetical protein
MGPRRIKHGEALLLSLVAAEKDEWFGGAISSSFLCFSGLMASVARWVHVSSRWLPFSLSDCGQPENFSWHGDGCLLHLSKRQREPRRAPLQ